MSDDKIKLYNGDYLYANASYDAISADKGNYRNSLVWDVLNKYDKNGNSSLDSNEVSLFTKKVAEYAGKDKVLNEKEANSLANELGISVKDLLRVVDILSAQPIVKSLLGIFSEKNNDDNRKQIVDLVNEINAASVAEVWGQYQKAIDEKNSNLLGVIKKDSSLAKDIMANYSFEEAIQLLDRIFDAMCEDASARNVKIETLIKKYNVAKEKSNKKEIDIVLRELAARLNSVSIANDVVNEEIEKYGLTDENTEMSDAIRKQAYKYATDSGAVISDDIEGDGVLGNTKSVPTKNNGKINDKAAKVLIAINELLKDPIIAEKLQACVRKENNILVTRFPGTWQTNIDSENSLTYDKDAIGSTVVGDSDMSNFIHSILKSAEGQVRDGLKFDKFDDIDALKAYIMELVEPDIVSLNRLYQKGSIGRIALDKFD